MRIENYDDKGKLVGQPVTVADPPEVVNADTLSDRVASALATNRAFIDAAKPGTAAGQASAAYDATVRHARQLNALIRLTLGLLDGTD